MKKLLIAITLLSIAASFASADVLWDQSEYDPGFSVWNAQTGCGFTGSTVHQASDIIIHDQVTVNQITTYYSMTSGWEIESVTEAYLYIGAKTAPLPIDGVDVVNDPALLVPVTIAAFDPGNGGAWAYTVTASGLNVALMPGEYWVSLTPANYFTGPQGPNYHYAAANHWGDDVATIEYCGMFGDSPWANYASNAGRDVSLLIEGTIDVVPTENESWGDVKALYR